MEVIVSPEGTSELKEHKDKDQIRGHLLTGLRT
jgi:hypothetical protein